MNLSETENRMLLHKPRSLVIVFFMFFLFFPIKTQFYNLILISLDYILTSGKITQIYNYNYLGQLIGCSELTEATVSLGSQFSNFNFFIRITHIFLAFGSVLLFLKRRQINSKFNIVDWILLIVFCFSVIDALEYFANMLFNSSDIVRYIASTKFSFFINTALIVIGLYILFLKLQPSERFQLYFIALPASILSFFLWFIYLGPHILPLDIS